MTGVTVLLGWDRSTETGPSAAPLDNDLSGSSAMNADPNFDTLVTSQLAGGRKDSGDRPYGTYYAANMAVGTTADLSTWTRLFDVRITNTGLLPSESYTLRVWDTADTTLNY